MFIKQWGNRKWQQNLKPFKYLFSQRQPFLQSATFKATFWQYERISGWKWQSKWCRNKTKAKMNKINFFFYIEIYFKYMDRWFWNTRSCVLVMTRKHYILGEFDDFIDFFRGLSCNTTPSRLIETPGEKTLKSINQYFFVWSSFNVNILFHLK